MNMSHGGSSTKQAPNPSKCSACGETGYFVECKDTKSDTKPEKVVHNEVIGLITLNEGPVLSETKSRGWFLASRCTVHVCNSKDMFVEYHPWSGHEVVLESNNHVEVAGIGTVVLRLTTGKVLTLSNVFHIPTVRKCIVAIFKLGAFKISCETEGVSILDDDNEIVGKGYIEDGLYRLSLMEEDTCSK